MMRINPFFLIRFVLVIVAGWLLSACNSAAWSAAPTNAPVTAATPTTPDWFNVELTDVQTGQPFTVHDFAGKVVLVETMAEWCPACRREEDEVKKLHSLLGNRPDLVSISLDVEDQEDAASLHDYANLWGYDWHFALAPLQVQRALGNLYNAEYLNPPYIPMLLIDRQGKVYGLPYGIKNAGSLQLTLAGFLSP